HTEPIRDRSWERELEEIEEYVIECLISNNLDIYLTVLVDIVFTSESENRPLYSVIEEPVIYRFLKGYIMRGIESAKKIKEASSAMLPQGGAGPG
ncbi:unnamed protein product, partial [marine sediment metagenome]